MKFISGIELSRAFYERSILPILSDAGFSKFTHSAGLLDSGSEVFGCDDVRSRDHHWGPRVHIFLTEDDFKIHGAYLSNLLCNQLPHEFMGYPTNFGEPDDCGVQHLVPIDQGPVNHRVIFLTVSSFFVEWFGRIDPSTRGISLENWREFPMQSLFAIRKGVLFRDDLDMDSVRKKLWFYPKTIWLEKLIEEWSKIHEEEAFVGRCGEVNDEMGSRLITARILNSLMKITFLLEKEYYPYSKWFGTVFSKLRSSAKLKPFIMDSLGAESWKDREAALSNCYSAVMALHNTVPELPDVDPEVSYFYTRPFKVPHSDRIIDVLKKTLVECGESVL